MIRLFKYFTKRFQDLQLRKKLYISYFLIITIPMVIISFSYYNISSDTIARNAQNDIFSITQNINNTLDVRFSSIKEKTLLMNIDRELFEIFENIDTGNNMYLYSSDARITDLLYKYFPQDEDIYSVNLITSYFTFGRNITSYIPLKSSFNDEFLKSAYSSRGNISWIPTYDFSKIKIQNKMSNAAIKDRYLFSAIREINCSYIENDGHIVALDKNIERPVLLINFKEDIFKKIFENKISVEGCQYFVITRDGAIISQSGDLDIFKSQAPEWFRHVTEQQSGTEYVEIDGERKLISYDTSKETGWIFVTIVPYDKLLSNLPVLKVSALAITAILIIVAFIFSALISNGITKPISRLLVIMKGMGKGNFDAKLEEINNDEMGYLFKKFNEMNERIQRLLKENYEVTIREKELQILAYNLQFEPHFMYNTLNMINLMAIEQNQSEISKMIMSLSTMLRYTVKNISEVVEFEEDYKYIKSYIYIMQNRFEGKFTVEEDFDALIVNMRVPKLFLQPILENAIIHGFEKIERGGKIRISSWINEDIRWICIEDNGCGMSPEKVSQIMNSPSDKIGVRNVDMRVKALYGGEYGISIESVMDIGTKVFVKLPLN